jgi:hypothetical protein
MKTILVGLLIAALGGVALWFGGVPYTERTRLLDVGPIQATAETRERFDIPPMVGGAILALGVGIAVYGAGRGHS